MARKLVFKKGQRFKNRLRIDAPWTEEFKLDRDFYRGGEEIYITFTEGDKKGKSYRSSSVNLSLYLTMQVTKRIEDIQKETK